MRESGRCLATPRATARGTPASGNEGHCWRHWTAIGALRQAGNDIGEILTTCISLFNPEIISVGGRLATAGDHLIAGIKEVVYQKAAPFAAEGLTIVRSLEPLRAGLVGAGLMATEIALERENLDRLLPS